MPIERLARGDLVELVTDVGPAPSNVAALLVLRAPTDAAQGTSKQGTSKQGGSSEALVAELARRVRRIPRLSQVLATPPRGLGAPYWHQAAGLHLEEHVTVVPCPGDGGLEDLLELTARTVVDPLPRDRPLWRALVVTGPDRRRPAVLAVLVVLHHVLADGMGGLAVLARLADGPGPEPEPWPDPTPAGGPLPGAGGARSPKHRDLLGDAWAHRLRALGAAPASVRTMLRGRKELMRAGRGPGAARCSLNEPTGSRRALAVVEVDLAGLRRGLRAHRRGGEDGEGAAAPATVNDALLVATTGAMGDALRARGEAVEQLVVSVPVSARAQTDASALGNRVGVMTVRVPLEGTAHERLEAARSRTAAQKSSRRGDSSALVAPAFRSLAALGVFRWFIDRQRLVNTFLTNLAGPVEPLRLAGYQVERLIPVIVSAGNVGVAFAALSYAGRLTVTVVTDPQVVPEGATIARALERDLDALAGPVP